MGMSKEAFTRALMGHMQTKRNNSIKVTDEGLRFYIERTQKRRIQYLREVER